MTWEELKEEAKKIFGDKFSCDMTTIISVGELETSFGTLILATSGHITFLHEFEHGSTMVTIAKVKTPEQMLAIMKALQ